MFFFFFFFIFTYINPKDDACVNNYPVETYAKIEISNYSKKKNIINLILSLYIILFLQILIINIHQKPYLKPKLYLMYIINII